MLLEIHNLPFNINYNEIKDFLRNQFGLNGFILDNLEQESPRSKKITVGLADESDAAILARKVHGTYLRGQQLNIKNAKQIIAAEQPHNASVLHNVHNFLAPMSQASNPNPFMSMPYQMFNNIPFMQAPTFAPVQVQVQQSDNGTYQNNIPDFRVDTRMSDTQGRRDDNHSNRDRDDHRDRSRKRNSNRNHNEHHDNKYCDRRGNSDRNAYRDRSETLNRGPHRDSDVNRDRDGNGDRHRSSFSYHDSSRSRNNAEPENINTHKSKWEAQFHNQRDLKANKKNSFKHSASNSPPYISPWIQSNHSPKSQQNIFSSSNCIQQPYGPSNESNFFNKPSYVVSDSYDLPNQMSIQDCWNTQNESQADNLKQNYGLNVSFNAPPSAQVPAKKKFKPNNALPPKKATIVSIPLQKRMNRHNTWVQQITSLIARQVLESAGDLENKAVFLELKKCIQNRINMIFGNKLADTIDEIKYKYKKHYNADKNYELYKAILENVSDIAKYGEQSDNKDIEATPTPQPSQSTSANLLAHDIASTSQSVARPVPQMQKKSPENLDVQPNLPKIAAANVKHGEQQQVGKPAILHLNEPYSSTLKDHVTYIQMLAAEHCKEVDKELGVHLVSNWKRSVFELRKVLEMHTTNRILNFRNNLIVRIYCHPEPPNRNVLEAFLKQYNVISLKNSDNKKMFTVNCGTYQGFDNLCQRKQATIDDKLVFFKPLHLIRRQKRKLKKCELVIEHAEDNDSDDFETIEKDIAECKQDILNDSDIIVLEAENDIIDLDEEEAENIETYDKRLRDVETNKLVSNDSSFEISFTSNSLQNIANIHNGQSDFKETEISDKSDADNVPKETINYNQNNNADTLLDHVDVKHDSQNLIVGDNSYVVLDDVNDEDGANDSDCKFQNIQDLIKADIDEDDLEDF